MPATYGGDYSSVFVENQEYEVAFSVTGGTFQTKIGCNNTNQLAGAVTGGIFTEEAKENTNATLINESYEFVANDDGTYRIAYKTTKTADALVQAFEKGGLIVLGADIVLDTSLTVASGKEVVLDLNGYDITYTTDVQAATQLILNNGTLTIRGEGTLAYHSDGYDGNQIPGYATNAITNKGRLTICEGVTVRNTSLGGASYAIDNDGYFHLDGGSVIAQKTAVRVCAFVSPSAELLMDGGLIEGSEGVRIQLAGNNPTLAPHVTVTVNGGILRSTKGSDGFALCTYSFGESYANTTIIINGGQFNGWATVGTGNYEQSVNVTVTGGTFDCGDGVYNYATGEYIESH